MDSKIIHISSSESLFNNNSSDFSYSLVNEIKDVTHLTLKSIEIPSNPYVFDKRLYSNTNFIIIDNTNIEYEITIEDGNYKPEELSTHINDLIKSKNISYKIEFNYNKNNGLTTFNSVNKFKLKFPKNMKTSLGLSLGFKKTEYSNNKSYTSEMALDINPIQVYFVKINDLGKIVTSFDDKIFAKLVLYRDSDICHPYTGKVKILSENVLYEEHPVNINRFNIRILDEYGNLVDFKGLNITMSLDIKHIRTSEKKKEVYEKLLKTYSNNHYFNY